MVGLDVPGEKILTLFARRPGSGTLSGEKSVDPFRYRHVMAQPDMPAIGQDGDFGLRDNRRDPARSGGCAKTVVLS